MWPKQHIIIGFFAALGLYLIFPAIGLLEASLIFLSTVLIDADHYLYYVFKTKDISFFNALKWFADKKRFFYQLSPSKRAVYVKKCKNPFLIFHGLEFILLVAVLTYYYPILFWTLIGFTIHLVMDYHEIISLGANPIIKISQIYVYIANKNKKDFKDVRN